MYIYCLTLPSLEFIKSKETIAIRQLTFIIFQATYLILWKKFF